MILFFATARGTGKKLKSRPTRDETKECTTEISARSNTIQQTFDHAADALLNSKNVINYCSSKKENDSSPNGHQQRSFHQKQGGCARHTEQQMGPSTRDQTHIYRTTCTYSKLICSGMYVQVHTERVPCGEFEYSLS